MVANLIEGSSSYLSTSFQDLWLCNGLSPNLLEFWLKYIDIFYLHKIT